MPSPFPVGPARLAGLYVESVILGLYLVTFVNTLHALFFAGTRWKRIREIHKTMSFVALFMFVNVALGSATSVFVVWKAYVLSPPGKGEATFSELSSWPVVLKSADLLTQTTIGDAMLIYRCWIVYGRSWLVIIPSFVLWLGGTVCSVFLVYYEATTTTSALITASKLHPYGVAFWASTVSLNIITTTLLVWPIWKVARHHEQFAYQSTNSGSLNIMKDVTYVIIESGLMYTVAAFMTFVTYTTKHNSLYIVSSAEVGIAGIAFNLIITRTAQAVRAKKGLLPQVPFQHKSPRNSSVPTEQTHVHVHINGTADYELDNDHTRTIKSEHSEAPRIGSHPEEV
ncbi:hypothetical protein DXG01_002826 [Tephrocybe rancida]|nr:hypothetical protein DXG01_002826 [Tephrocybe rancida]